MPSKRSRRGRLPRESLDPGFFLPSKKADVLDPGFRRPCRPAGRGDEWAAVRHRWPWLIGLTGGIGSGKSTVLAFFKEKGAFVVDADAIVKEMLAGDASVKRALKKRFGPAMFDPNGHVRKAELAALVFVDVRARRTLEKIIHPRVRKAIRQRLSKGNGTVAVCDIPLLFESGWTREFDAIVVVNAARAARLERLLKKGFERKDSLARMKSQWPLQRKAARADYVINNSGTFMNTKRQVSKLWNTLNHTVEAI